MKKKISILGCGWLGLPLAVNLKKNNYSVQGSTKTTKRIKLFRQKSIPHSIINFSPETTLAEGEITNFFNCDILIISLPLKFNPQLSPITKNIYFQSIQKISQKITQFKIKKVILLSSTSAYEHYENHGLKTRVINENSPLKGLTNKSKLIRKSELELLKNNNYKTIVFRLGGLIGRKRNPVYWIKKPKLRSKNNFLNLIHYRDVVEIICLVINNHFINNEIYNLVSDKIYLKKFFYQQILNHLSSPKKLSLPPYQCSYKIDGSKVKEKLNYKMSYPDPLGWALKSKAIKKNK